MSSSCLTVAYVIAGLVVASGELKLLWLVLVAKVDDFLDYLNLFGLVALFNLINFFQIFLNNLLHLFLDNLFDLLDLLDLLDLFYLLLYNLFNLLNLLDFFFNNLIVRLKIGGFIRKMRGLDCLTVVFYCLSVSHLFLLFLLAMPSRRR